jgi:hypothetical protein
MEVMYLSKYKTCMLLRQPPFIVFSSWRGGYNFVNHYKRNLPLTPTTFSDGLKKKMKSCVLCKPSFCFEYRVVDNFNKSTNSKKI